MPSTYTQNLGIELPATGEQANTWGLTVNRNMDTVDKAINGNIQLTAPAAGSPYQLIIDDGADAPVAANPLIIWTGSQSQQGSVHIDYQSDRKHLYIMSNQTSGGFGLAFAQGTGTQFVLQALHDAIIYADGGGLGANVAAALANPQFATLLVTGNAQVSGALQVTGAINGVFTTDAQSNVHLTGALGVGNPSSIPDTVTINGPDLRLAYGNYGVIFRNDGSQLYLLVTAAGSPYGGWVAPYPIQIDLASRTVGILWGPDGTHALNVSSIHTGSLAVDGAVNAGSLGASGAVSGATVSASGAVSAGTTINAGSTISTPGAITASGTVSGGSFSTGGGISAGGTVSAASVTVSGGRSYFNSNDPYTIGLQWSTAINYVGTNASGQFQVSNSGGAALLVVDASGNTTITGGASIQGNALIGAGLTAGGRIHSNALGFQFPDGTVQTTAATTTPPAANTLNFYVNHTLMGPGPNLDIFSLGGGIVISSTQFGSYGIGFASSDARLKQHIQPLTGGLAVIERLHPVRAKWNGLASTTKGKPIISVLAQDLQSIEPDAVYSFLNKLRSEDEEPTELLGFDPMAIISHLILAIQQLNKAR